MLRYTSRITLLAAIGLSLIAFAQNKNAHSDKKHNAHWSYTGKTGPEHWSELNTAYSLCNGGKEQSPIDFNKAEISDLDKLQFYYKSAPIDLINNGHTIQENIDNGSRAVINGKIYKLVQFHFHTPSEHTINGKHYVMELHLVHTDNNGEIAVVGILFEEGKANAELQKIIDNLPKEINKSSINKAVNINLNALLPADRTYFHYFGSLTTPPCSEQVNWNVFKAPLEASAKQINTLKEIMGNNSRPVQKLNNRFVSESK